MAEVLEQFKLEAREVRKGTYFDVQKAFVDGKPLILEGSHIDP